MKDQIDRLGFETWADNLIVNAIEDGSGNNFVSHSDHVSVVLSLEDGFVHASVRAYVPAIGWLYHERALKSKPSAK